MKDSTSCYVESMEITITGFRPMRSATIPQKIDAKALPTIYDAPTIEVFKSMYQILIFLWNRKVCMNFNAHGARNVLEYWYILRKEKNGSQSIGFLKSQSV